MCVFDEYTALYKTSKEIVRWVLFKAIGAPNEYRIKMSCVFLLELMDDIGVTIGYPNLMTRNISHQLGVDNPFAAIIKGSVVLPVIREQYNVQSFVERLRILEENATTVQSMRM